MDIVGSNDLYGFFEDGNIKKTTCSEVRSGPGCYVSNYLELAKKVAEVNFRNPGYVFLFRGQDFDFKRPGNEHDISTIKASIWRNITDKSLEEIDNRFETLMIAEDLLIEEYKRIIKNPEDYRLQKIERYRLLRWSILQHYQIVSTPLLDVTHSLRIAASFADTMSKKMSETATQRECFVFMLGVPNIGGAFTACADIGLQIIRLSSVCPPEALRPHIQEGYLLGELPEITGNDQKQHYAQFELDFGRRLVAKFRFNPDEFWTKSTVFPQIKRKALYPDRDPFEVVTKRIRAQLADDNSEKA